MPPTVRPDALGYDPLVAIEKLSAADKPLGKLIARAGPYRLEIKHLHSPFMALAESVVYQQLTGKAAATIFGRVRALCANPDAPTPGDLLAASSEALRGAGLSGAKLASLKDLAQRAQAGEIPSIEELHAMDDEAIVEKLTAVRGVGRWTVEMLLMFRLGRGDVLPVTDYGVRKGFARTFRKRDLPTPREMLARGERWRPYRSVASWYLWRALDTE